MAKDFSFLFYPGDVLRHTQFFNKQQKGCYLEVLTSHIENIRFSYDFLMKITRELCEIDKAEFIAVFEKDEKGYFIFWAVEAIQKRAAYLDSRGANKAGKTKESKPTKPTKKKKSYDNHMENKNENEIENTNTIKTEPETPEQKLKKRESEFTETIRPFLSQYPRDMLLAFFNYWTEPNQSKTKMKFELQPTWDIGRRLKTWADNQKNFKKPENDRVKNSNELDELLRESIVNLSADNG